VLIGVTGGIGAGKSHVALKLGLLLDAPLFNADDICRELLEPDQYGYREVVSRWGERFLDGGKNIDRPKLRRETFENTSIRLHLEAILHPAVKKRLAEASAAVGKTGFIIAEVPLLYECGWQEDFDWVISVFVPPELAALRVAERDNTSIDEVRTIIDAQLDPVVKKERADSVIDNRSDWLETEKQLDNLAAFLRQRFLQEPVDK
jgi:dephospho-CoA kinase